MKRFTCEKKCCSINFKLYNNSNYSLTHRSRNNRKAGVFIYDPKEDKVLLVQSRGHLWGLPKGTLQYGESERMCAVREVKEETGLEISSDDFSRATMIRNCALYFYLERNICDLQVQDHITDNDVNALGWIKPDCLEQFIINGNITLNQHCRIVFERFLNRTFPKTTFLLVK